MEQNTTDKERERIIDISILDREQGDDTSDLWTVPYGNLMTILMIFFMVLYSFTYMGQNTKYEKMIANLQTEMGDKTAQKKTDEINMAEKLDDYLEKSDIKEFASVVVSAQNIKITLSNPVLFDSGKADIKQAAHSTLDEIALMLRSINNPVVVEGHTDNVPISSGKFKSNFELSAARAFSVIEYFISGGGLPKEIFSCLGYGEFVPVSGNDTEEGRGANRRIEINILREKK